MSANVLQLIGSFGQGGSERQAVQLTRLLHGRGRFSVRVAALDARGPLREEVERLGLAEEVAEYPLTSFYDPNFVKQLRRLVSYLRREKIEIIQTHDFYSNIFGMSAAAIARTPVRIAARRETTGMRTRAQQYVQSAAYRLAHSIVANAEAVRRQLISEGAPDAKIATIYNGLDLERMRPQPGLSRSERLALFNLPQTENLRFVTIVANMRAGHEVKDHATFLRAARRVREGARKVAFALAGEGELTEKLKGMASELGIAEDVYFTGRCLRVADLLSVSDVCVLSSKAEGFSNSILEYMAAARPVVVTDVGGAREAVEDGASGYVVAPGDVEGMAARIAELLSDGKRAEKMGERGRRIVQEKFSCEAQLERTEKLYETLLSRSRRPTKARALGEAAAPTSGQKSDA